MNKIIIKGVALLVAGVALTGCSDEVSLDRSGEGRIYLRTKVSTDVKVVSRAATENAELASAATIWISGQKGLVRKYNGIDEVPADGIQLVAGNYVAEAWTGDSVAASFDTRWFKGREEFEITDGSVTQVELVCKIANSVVSLTYDDAVAEVLTDCSFEVGHNGGTLTFDETTPADAKGYFMMSSYDKDLHYTLTATRTDGKGTYTCSGEIKDARPATEYRIRVKHDGTVVNPIGGALITIEVDETPLEEINDVYELTAAPVTTGIGFDIAKPVVGSEGAVEARSLWIAATSALTEVEVACPAFSAMFGLSGNDFEIFHIEDAEKAILRNAGVTWQVFDHPETGFQEVKLMFSDAAMGLFPKGDNTVTITATDESGRSSVTGMTVKVTDATVEAVEIAPGDLSIHATSATFTGRILKDGASRAGIRYAKAGSSDWTDVEAQPRSRAAWAAGDEYSVTVENLEPGTTYQYKAFTDDVESPNTCTITTEDAPQLPNSSFEDWHGDMPVMVYGEGQQMFWDSGNTGSKMAKTNLTTPSEDYKHSGRYSARLESKFASVYGFGAFAAGNLFVGEFLGTENLSKGILGWGRAFTGRPKALRGYVKYTPAVVEYAGGGVNKGDMDRGIIYMALVDNTTQSYGKYSGWPQIVATKDIDNHSFKKDGANQNGFVILEAERFGRKRGVGVVAEAEQGRGGRFGAVEVDVLDLQARLRDEFRVADEADGRTVRGGGAAQHHVVEAEIDVALQRVLGARLQHEALTQVEVLGFGEVGGDEGRKLAARGNGLRGGPRAVEVVGRGDGLRIVELLVAEGLHADAVIGVLRLGKGDRKTVDERVDEHHGRGLVVDVGHLDGIAARTVDDGPGERHGLRAVGIGDGREAGQIEERRLQLGVGDAAREAFVVVEALGAGDCEQRGRDGDDTTEEPRFQCHLFHRLIILS